MKAFAGSMESDFTGPVNIGSEEMVTINQLAEIVMQIAGKKLTIKHIAGPLGVRGRNSDNRLIAEKLGWKPSRPLREGLEKTYSLDREQMATSRSAGSAAKRIRAAKSAFGVQLRMKLRLAAG